MLTMSPLAGLGDLPGSACSAAPGYPDPDTGAVRDASTMVCACPSGSTFNEDTQTCDIDVGGGQSYATAAEQAHCDPVAQFFDADSWSCQPFPAGSTPTMKTAIVAQQAANAAAGLPTLPIGKALLVALALGIVAVGSYAGYRYYARRRPQPQP